MTTPCFWDGGQTSHTLDAVLHKGQTMPEKKRFPAILEPLVFQSYASATNSMNPGSVSPTLDKGKGDGVAVALPIHDQATQHSGKRSDKSDGKGNGLCVGKEGDPCPTLTKGGRHAVGFTQNSRDEVRLQGGDGQVSGALAANEGMKQRTYIADGGMVVRRLTPVECERLQGFSDNWTRIAWRGKQDEQCPDGPRYKAIGNSMAVPVMHWIGERIQMVEDILNERVSEKDSAAGAG